MKNDIVIEIRGGCLVGVYCNNRDHCVILLDWDNLNELPKAEYKNEFFPINLHCEMPDDTRYAYEHSVSGNRGEIR